MAERGDGRTRLSAAKILDRALALADAEGLEKVTVRRLTQELGVTPMALYWHFRTKEELLAAMADRLLAEVDLAVADAPWPDQFAALIRALVAVLRAHPAAPGLLARGGPTEHWLNAQETALGILRRAGFTPAEATQVSRHAMHAMIALATGESGVAPPARGEEFERYFESLPAARYPRLVEAAGPLSHRPDADAYYDFGIELLLAGVTALAARPAATRV